MSMGKYNINIKPMIFVLLVLTLLLAIASASAADDMSSDAVIAESSDLIIDEASSSPAAAVDTQTSDIYSADSAITYETNASDDIDTNTISDAAKEGSAKNLLASNSGSLKKLGAGQEDVGDIEFTYPTLYGGDVCNFTVTLDSQLAGGNVTVTIIDTCVPEDEYPRTIVYVIPVVNGVAEASNENATISIDDDDVDFDEVTLAIDHGEWENDQQKYPDSVKVEYSGDELYAPKTLETSMTILPFEAQMKIEGDKIGAKYAYGESLGLVNFEVNDPFDFNNPANGEFLVVILPDSVDTDEFDPMEDIGEAELTAIVSIDGGTGSLRFDNVFDAGQYWIGLYYDEETYPNYVVWEGFEVIGSTVDPFVLSSSGIGYASLAKALENAADGDTITVINPGNYTGIKNTGLTVNKSVTIAAPGQLRVIFDCENNNNFLTITSGNEVFLKDIIVYNGKAEKGGAVYLENEARLTVDGIEFSHNTANTCGGAIYSEGGVIAFNSVFYQNDISTGSADGENGGAAIYNYGGSLYLDNCGIDENLMNYDPETARARGDLINGVIMTTGSTLILDSRFYKNRGSYGAAITVLPLDDSTVSLIIEGSRFNQNAAYYGTVYVAKGAKLEISNSTFIKNNASQKGGAIYSEGDLYVDNVEFEANYVYNGTQIGDKLYNYGGAIDSVNSLISVNNSRFSENKAIGGEYNVGGAIHITNASNVLVSDSVFENNGVEEGWGGAVAVDNVNQASAAALARSNFTKNYASQGGAVAIFIKDYDKEGYVLIQSCNFDANSLTEGDLDNYGAAISIGKDFDERLAVSIEDSNFTNHKGDFKGTVMSGNALLVVNGSNFADNKAVDGAGIYSLNTVLYVNSSSFKNNEANTAAGIYINGSNITIVMHSIFEDNIGAQKTFNIYSNDSKLHLASNTFKTIKPTIVLANDSYEFGDEISISGDFDWGVNQAAINMTYLINSFESFTEVTNGQYNITIDSQPDVGTYTMAISSFSDEYDNYYGVETAQELFIVTKASPVLEVLGDAVPYGDPAIIIVKVSDKNGEAVSGYVIVTVEGDTQFVTLEDDGTGLAIFDLEDLDIGTYPVSARFLENDLFKSAVNDTASITIGDEADAIVSLEISDEGYGTPSTVTVTITDIRGNPLSGTVNVYIDGVNIVIPVTVSEEGKGTATTGILKVGNYTAYTQSNVEDHIVDEGSDEFEVARAQPIGTILVEDEYVYGQKVNVTLRLVDENGEGINETVFVKIYSGEYENESVELINGTATLELPELDAGIYELILNFEGNDKYEPLNEWEQIKVVKATPIVEVVGDTQEYGNPNTVNVTVSGNGLPLDGRVIIVVDWVVDGLTYVAELEEGSASVGFNLAPYVKDGKYNITATYIGTDNYEEVVNDTEVLTVLPSTSAAIELAGPEETPDYGEDAIINVVVKDGAGIVIDLDEIAVEVNGENKTYKLDEDGNLNLGVLPAGDNNITVYFDDGVHSPAEAEAIVKVDPASGADIMSNVSPGKAGENTTVDVSAKDPSGNPLDGNVIVLVDGEPYTSAALNNGTASIPIEGLESGDHTVEIVLDTPNYLPTSYTEHFTVNKQETELKVTVDKEDIVYGDGAVTATISLSAEGNPIDGTVEVALNGELQNLTVTGGKATVKFDDLAAGNYTVVASFAGDSINSDASDSVVFNVARKETYFKYNDMKTKAVNPQIDGRIGEYFCFTLLDADGNPLANKSVSIGFNGKVYNRTTNATGGARLQINLAKVFRYTFAIVFLGDENYTSTFNVALIEVSSQTPKLTTTAKTYKSTAKTKSLTASFKTAAGNPVSGRKISFTVNGKTYTAKTNAKGVATVKVSISKKGTYSFTAKFAGDDTYAAVSKSAKLTIK